MNAHKLPYKIKLTFNKKNFVVLLKINDFKDDDTSYHYDVELRTTEKISGNEFQKLKKYLENEGYIDQAIEYYSTD